MRKSMILSFLVAALFCWDFLAADSDIDPKGIPDPCSLKAEFCQSGNRCIFVCPQGDGQLLSDGGNEICITIKDMFGNPIEGVLASDFWVYGCGEEFCLCGGSGSADADAPTDEFGQTQISGGIAAGGCELTGLHVIVMGFIMGCPPTCLPITVLSPDLDCDLDIDLVDFSLFAGAYPPNPFDPCCDYDCDGDVDLVDFALFAQHWQHQC